jgi:hypothetical protein
VNSRLEIADFWDQILSSFLAGESPEVKDPSLLRWRASYDGAGRGLVTTNAFPEPYIGPLSPVVGEPSIVALGLNPGEADLEFQGRGGRFAEEISALGGYSKWAATSPYLREPWRSTHRHNRYHAGLHAFARRWTANDVARSDDVLVFELYPWHSDKVTAAMSPDPDLIRRFVWDPIAETDVDVIFGFGKDWASTATALRLPETKAQVQFTVPSRRLRTFRLPSGQLLAVVWQPGYSGPPAGADVDALRRALVGTLPSPVLVPPVSTALDASAGRPLAKSAPDGPNPTGVRQPADASRAPSRRYAYFHSFADLVSRELAPDGFGRVRVPSSLQFMSIRWPEGL